VPIFVQRPIFLKSDIIFT